VAGDVVGDVAGALPADIGRQPPEKLLSSWLQRPWKIPPSMSVVIVTSSPSSSQRYGIGVPNMLGYTVEG
jgi:hypothetical protein